MANPALFTDASFDVKSRTGYGAYLLVDDPEALHLPANDQVQTRRFENTSPARLELETLLWALKDVSNRYNKVDVYTDSQTITGLAGRREHLEQNGYRSKNNRLLSNYDLYIDFYRVTDEMECRIMKAKGHQPAAQKDAVHKLFALVDKASRKGLRNALKGTSG